MRVPLPGQPVRGSKSGAPIMALFDLLGRGWAMGIVWTLAEEGPCGFRELQAHCETISPAVLNTRTKELRAAGLIALGEAGYQVTPLGRELYEILVPMGRWSKKWGRAVSKLQAKGA